MRILTSACRFANPFFLKNRAVVMRGSQVCRSDTRCNNGGVIIVELAAADLRSGSHSEIRSKATVFLINPDKTLAYRSNRSPVKLVLLQQQERCSKISILVFKLDCSLFIFRSTRHRCNPVLSLVDYRAPRAAQLFWPFCLFLHSTLFKMRK